jgi:transcriptional regulator with XRE-family HTH domain
MNEITLASYLKNLMVELNYASERSFAAYLGVSYSTVNRILRGEKVDPDSLIRISEALHVPVENLYRMAGYLPPEEMQTLVMREVEHLLRQMPEADQRRILDLVRVEYKHTQARQPKQGDSQTSSQEWTGS